MKDKKIKMVALDLDGTTLNQDKQISPRTVEDFRRAMETGVHIVVSTGRTFQSLPAQLYTIDGLEFAITSNGAHITELATKKTIYENYLSAQAVEDVVRHLRGTGLSVETFVEGRAYIDRRELDEMKTSGSTYRDREYVLSTRNPVDNIFDFILQNKSRIENISVNYEFLEEKEKWKSLLGGISGITLTSSFSHNFEIGGDSTSKAEALRFLMERVGVSAEELMACGDSLNDAEMIRLAAVGVVMGNASEEMKAIGDYVTDTNENEGVAKAIEKFVL